MKKNFSYLCFPFFCVSVAVDSAQSELAINNHRQSNQVPKQQIEVLHWWTSGSEAKALTHLKQNLPWQTHSWQDFSVEGLAGESAINTLRIRALSGKPPNVAQLKGPDIQRWASAGLLTSLTPVAETENWDSFIPSIIATHFKYKGEYVAAPLNIHRVNWLWVSPSIFSSLKLSYPTTLEELIHCAKIIQKAGYIPLALGNEPWQLATLFESIALSIMGVDKYRSAFIEQDANALKDPSLKKALLLFHEFRQFSDKKAKGRSWHDTAQLILTKKAAMQFMGDWVKGEFMEKNKKEGIDYQCIPAPGTQGAFSFNIDSLIFFRSEEKAIQKAQLSLASHALSLDTQREFNRAKGSIPIRAQVTNTPLDQCDKKALIAFKKATKTNQLVPSFSHHMALSRASQRALFDVLSHFYNSDAPNIEETMRHLRAGVLAHRL